jgi:hypothetical protein
MDCAQVARDELLEKYLNGQLESELERELQVHLLECRECLALLETCEEARDELAGRAAVLAEVPEKPIRGAGRSRLPWLSPLPAALLAGVATVVIVAAVFVSRTGMWSGHGQQAKNGSNVSNGGVTPNVVSGVESKFPELAGLPSAEKDAVEQAISSRTISYPPYLAGLRGKSETLLGASSEDHPFRALEPVGEAVIEAHPAFRWQALAGAGTYSVVVFDTNAKLVQSSPALRVTEWKPSQPLKRGQVYQWQVTAVMGDGKSVIAPSFPQPKAKFRVVDEAKANELEQFRQTHPEAHLVLGILSAQAGLVKSGEQELAQVPGNSRDYDLAQALLRSVRELR